MNSVSDRVKRQLVNQHNRLRRKVAMGQEEGQPAAADMRELVWDDELEAIAQR